MNRSCILELIHDTLVAYKVLHLNIFSGEDRIVENGSENSNKTE